MSVNRMSLFSENLYGLLKTNLEKYKELSETFDCHIMDLDIYYEHKLYEKPNSDTLSKVLKNIDTKYSYLALHDDKPIKISHGTSEENLEKILKQKRLIAGNTFNYGIWFTEVGTGYCWDFPKYINIVYKKPILRVIESSDEFMVPAMGCVIACETEIDLNEVEYSITDSFDKTIDLEIAHKSLGLPLDLREIKIQQLKSIL